ncbi:hypothetical protein [Terriglobus roseus]|uniref:Uncharacterized protein n=1 Tax=Terriglobus roseus TaxID=392734 RepID=A0A1G7GEF2_9BACT|nr:hypothetical protein [Terriglobus roseus]SDE86527.1 hypothetical protein SAMN05444167_0666 [Terriglobus roseus]
MSDELNNLWLAGDANVDLTGFRRPEESEENTADLWRQSKHGFEPRLADQTLAPKITFAEALAQDPGLAEEAARRDPKAFREYADSETERIALAFRKAHPAYMNTEKNSAAMLRHLCERFLNGVDHLRDEEVIFELFRSGDFTEVNLRAAFEALLRRGALDVGEGHVKQLSREELLTVIADLRTHGAAQAIATYLKFSLGTRTVDVRKVMVTNADLLKKACSTVWFHSKAGSVTADQFKEFAARRLSTIQLPTIEQIEAAWFAHQLETHEETDQPAQPKLATDEEINRLSDEDLENAMAAARKEFSVQRRRRRTGIPISTSQ